MGKAITIWATIGILICMCGLANGALHESKTVEAKCYDSNRQVILNQTCEKQVLLGNGETIEMILTILFILNLFLTPILLFQIQNYIDKTQK